VAASPNEQSRLAETASQFSEEDLTRYLQLTLDLFRDLQSSLQPRLHLEIGLIRMVYAGKLLPIEEALAEAGGSPAPRGSGSAASLGSTGPAGAEPRTAGPARAVSAAASKAAAMNPAPAMNRPVSAAAPVDPASTTSRALPDGDTRSRVHAALMEAKQIHVADALEHSSLEESPSELVFTTPKMYMMYLNQAEFEAAVRKALGKPVKITIKAGEAAAGQVAPTTPATAAASAADRNTRDPGDEAAARALAHPDVRRFQEMFPDSQVRKVRNLKEG
jgi:DNA polymerase III subunit gamma/tau